MFYEDQITDVFCLIDEFLLEFNKTLDKSLIGFRPKRKPRLSDAEVMTIMIIFQLSGFRCFKWFYIGYLKKHLRDYFPEIVSYNRFVELQKKVVFPLAVFAKTCCLSEYSGISFIDSTPLRVCKNKRIKRNKVFEDIATAGKSTMGYFYGFKLHLIVNERGQVIDFQITQAIVDDRKPLSNSKLIDKLWGKLYGDKGYVSKPLIQSLFSQGVHFITGVRKNMKNQIMSLYDKIMLRKRSIIETINDQLKNICMIEHSRHRSFHNFISNVILWYHRIFFFTGQTGYSFLSI